jgi:hypothetical protein
MRYHKEWDVDVLTSISNKNDEGEIRTRAVNPSRGEQVLSRGFEERSNENRTTEPVSEAMA